MDVSATDKLRIGLTKHIQVIGENLDAATVFFHEWKALSEDKLQNIQQKRDRYEAYWSQILAEGVQSGEFLHLDQKFAKLLILSVGNWLYQWYKPDGENDASTIANRFVDLMIHGFSHQGGDPID
nr:TetR/AcrR family transcriptional regulator C-terminal domain-containing protein [Polycladospora coralii]